MKQSHLKKTAKGQSFLAAVALLASLLGITVQACSLDTSPLFNENVTCTEDSHCIEAAKDNPCVVPSCENAGICVFNQVKDEIYGNGVHGDCMAVQCTEGQPSDVVMTDDISDGNPCTQDQCLGSTPQHITLTGHQCPGGPNGNFGTCDGSAQCIIDCASNADCPVSADTCTASYCDSAKGKCVFDKLDGTAAPGYDPPADCGGWYCIKGETIELHAVEGTLCTGEGVCDGMGLCKAPTCGDEVVQVAQNEACDDGNNDNGDACLNNCTAASCNDGFVYEGVEQCDDGNANNGDSCTTTCEYAICGDGFKYSGVEQCDDGNNVAGDGCEADCTITPPICGNGIDEVGEACDDGNNVAGDGCDPNCKPSGCGNGFKAGDEQCDDGNMVSGDGCDSNCTLSVCGNGIEAGAEQCDDGNAVNTDACLHTCLDAFCGDGFVYEGVEECDDANNNDDDGCHNDCTLGTVVCDLDGEVDPGEECDDGDTSNINDCTTLCKDAICGDGFVWDGHEDCDDGNVMDGDMCPADCTVP